MARLYKYSADYQYEGTPQAFLRQRASFQMTWYSAIQKSNMLNCEEHLN